MSPEATLAGFLSLWLRRFIVPGASVVDRIHRGVLFAEVCLVFGYQMDILSAMTNRLNAGLREFTTAMIEKPDSRVNFPRTEIPFMYLFGWLILHHPSQMDPALSAGGALAGNFIGRYAESRWKVDLLFDYRKVLNMDSNWRFFGVAPPPYYETFPSPLMDLELVHIRPPPVAFLG